MTRFWIRVNARLADSVTVRAFARELFPKLEVWIGVATACGLLVTLWGRMIDEQENGVLVDRDDDVLEEWAHWHGKRGQFARLFRTTFVAADGRVNAWDDYQGTLIAKREKDRERKRQLASKPTIPREVAATSARPSLLIVEETTDLPRHIPLESGESRVEVAPTSERNGNGNGEVPSAYAEGVLLSAPPRARDEAAALGAGPATNNPPPRYTPEARDALMRRGVPAAQVDAYTAPVPFHEAERQRIDADVGFTTWLNATADDWFAAHPDEATELELAERATMGFPPRGELSGLRKSMLRARLTETLRKREGWPTRAEWTANQLASPGAPP